MLELIKNPEGSFRYLPVLKDLKKRSNSASTILEVGGGDFNLVNFWKRRITVLDNAFNPTIKTPLVSELLSQGPFFPFGDKTFDYTVSLDTLEHIPTSQRSVFIKELLRVTRKGLYLGFPTGKLSENQDEKLSKIRSGQFLKEHLKNGLPKVSETLSLIKENGWELVWLESNVNLVFRFFLMSLWFYSSRSRLSKIFFKSLGLLSPFYKLFSFGNCYRQTFFFVLTSTNDH